jgi:lipoyl(octanoyl) transferase
MIEQAITIRWRGLQDYQSCWDAMKQFTDQRNENTVDEIWLLEHHPVFTQGQNGKPEHLLDPGDIPVVQTDRGGQITYHGPGQLMVYFLIDLKRKKFNVRQLVSLLEQSIVDLMAAHGVKAEAKCDAPGVYVAEEKLCSIGLRIRRGASYHGIAFNIQMDLSPFNRINPCGFSELKMTQFSTLVPGYAHEKDFEKVRGELINYLMKNLGYTKPSFEIT